MEVGDYVRTKGGKIGKLIGNDVYDENQVAILIDDTKDIKITPVIDKEQIINSSPRIIDLIQLGDYVNGYKVLNVLDFNDNSKMLSLEKIYDSKITNEDIKSIVTKEQFESMEYRIGGKNE